MSGNRAPIFHNRPGDAVHNRVWSYRVDVTDPDGDPLTVSVEQRPSWVSWDSASRTFSGLPDWENIGTHVFRLRADDGNRSATQQFLLTVVAGEIDCSQNFGLPEESPYRLPYRSGKTYELIQTYCPPNPAWGHFNWFAYDFNTGIGDTLLATRAGTVIITQEQFQDGTRICGQENLVIIEHADRTAMMYVHLTRNGALVEVGQRVEAGEPIGLSGDSGCSSGPHVHLALFRDRTSFNRQYSQPFNFSNADGPLDGNRGLVQSTRYRAR